MTDHHDSEWAKIYGLNKPHVPIATAAPPSHTAGSGGAGAHPPVPTVAAAEVAELRAALDREKTEKLQLQKEKVDRGMCT